MTINMCKIAVKGSVVLCYPVVCMVLQPNWQQLWSTLRTKVQTMKPLTCRELTESTPAASTIGGTLSNIIKAGSLPDSKLDIARTGVSNLGSDNTEYLSRNNDVIALCDADLAGRA
jgi:hypothetical protein